MSQDRPSSPARLLAPIALVVFAIAFFAILLSSGGGSSSGSTKERPAASTSAGRTTTTPRPATKPSYTVRTGDTLASISEKTGVPVQRLQELNPQLDPQALVSGQKIKLRE